MGGARYAQLTAALAVACAPVLLVTFGFYSMNAIEVLLCTSCFTLLLGALRDSGPKLWLGFGLLSGLALLNKHTFLGFGAGLLAGLLATRGRAHLATPWPWLAGGLAALLALPNLLWQIGHDWASLEFYLNAVQKNVPTSPLEALASQVVLANPASLPLWAAGVLSLLLSERARPFRPLGAMCALLVVVTASSGLSRQDRLAALLPLLFAAGACFWEAAAGRRLRVALAALPAVGAVLVLPLSVPYFSPSQVTAYAQAVGAVPKVTKGETYSALPHWFAERLGWESMVSEVVATYRSLPAPERERVVILSKGFGPASALELLWEDAVPVYSPHNSYYFWGPPRDGAGQVVIAVGFSPEVLSQYFADVRLSRRVRCAHCVADPEGLGIYVSPEMPVFVVRRPHRPLAEVWEELGWFL